MQFPAFMWDECRDVQDVFILLYLSYFHVLIFKYFCHLHVFSLKVLFLHNVQIMGHVLRCVLS